MSSMARMFIVSGAVLALLSVVAGALAAHAPADSLSAEQQRWLAIGIDYQRYHALALILFGVCMLSSPSSRIFRWAGVTLLLGVVLFCGTLYAMALTQMRGIGVLTPFGGLLLILGWLLFATAGWRMLHK